MICKGFLLSLLANVCLLSALVAQGDYQYFGGTTVIAPSGINMRQSPGLNSPKNGAIPYATKVEIVDSMVSVFDTVDYAWTIWDGKEFKRPVVGGWLKVKYKAKVGYVFTGLLGGYMDRDDSPDLLIRDVGFACEEIFFDMRDYYWYGLFPGKTHTEIREIKPTIYDFSEDLPGTVYTSGEQEICLMIIGSKKRLPAQSLKRPGGLPLNLKKDEQNYEDYHGPAFSLIWENDIQVEENEYMRLVLEMQGQKFPLEWQHIETIEEYETIIVGQYTNAELVFHGDINGDGYLDLILRTYDDEANIYLFYGSSQRLHGVASFFHGPCC